MSTELSFLLVVCTKICCKTNLEVGEEVKLVKLIPSEFSSMNESNCEQITCHLITEIGDNPTITYLAYFSAFHIMKKT